MMSTMRKHFGPILFSLCLGAVLCCTSGRADTITFETLPDENFFAGGGQNIAGFYPGQSVGSQAISTGFANHVSVLVKTSGD